MKYDLKYPDGNSREPLIQVCERVGKCSCRTSTRWRFGSYGIGVPMCSEECLALVLDGAPMPETPQLDEGCTSQGADCQCRQGFLTKAALEEVAAKDPIVKAVVKHREAWVNQILAVFRPPPEMKNVVVTPGAADEIVVTADVEVPKSPEFISYGQQSQEDTPT